MPYRQAYGCPGNRFAPETRHPKNFWEMSCYVVHVDPNSLLGYKCSLYLACGVQVDVARQVGQHDF
jgi:hypothetical protein